MASSEVLEDGLRRVERYSGIVAEGISFKTMSACRMGIRDIFEAVEDPVAVP
jgi:hypothetical protein